MIEVKKGEEIAAATVAILRIQVLVVRNLIPLPIPVVPLVLVITTDVATIAVLKKHHHHHIDLVGHAL